MVSVNEDKKKKPPKTKYAPSEGPLKVSNDRSNWFKDVGRAGLNFAGDASQAVRSMLGEKDTRGGYSTGDWMLGTNRAAKSSRKPATGSTDRYETDWQQQRAGQDLVEEVTPELTFADYLKMANEMSTGSGTDYSALINQMKSNAGEGDARLNAMYSQLQQSINNDAPGIQATYDEAKAAQDASAAQAAATTAQGYNQAREAQSAQMATLGIEEAAGVLAANGANAARDQSVANSNIAQVRGINTGQTAGNKASALTYNTRIGQAAGAEGTSQRATLQQSLANKLAELQVQQSQENAGRNDQNWSRASQLADWDNAAAQRRAGPSAKDELEMMMLAEKLTALQSDNAQAALGGNGFDPALYAQMQQLGQQYGIDPSDQEAMSGFIDQMTATKKLFG